MTKVGDQWIDYQSKKAITAKIKKKILCRLMYTSLHFLCRLMCTVLILKIEAITRTMNAMLRDTVLTHSRCSESIIDELMENNEWINSCY